MTELLNPQTFEVTLPSHQGMPEANLPVFVFKTRTWRKTIELDEITAKFRALETDGEIAALLIPPIKELLIAEQSADIERLSYMELVELFVSMRECEKIELNLKKNLLLLSLSDVAKSAESDAETVENPRPSSSIVPDATVEDVQDAADAESLT